MGQFRLVQVFTALLMVAGMQCYSLQSINGETWLDGQYLGLGSHQISTIQKDGKTFYQVQTSLGGKTQEPKLIPAKDGAMWSSVVIGNNMGVAQVPNFEIPKFNMPNIEIPKFVMPKMPVIPPINVPAIVMPSMNFLPWMNFRK